MYEPVFYFKSVLNSNSILWNEALSLTLWQSRVLKLHVQLQKLPSL